MDAKHYCMCARANGNMHTRAAVHVNGRKGGRDENPRDLEKFTLRGACRFSGKPVFGQLQPIRVAANSVRTVQCDACTVHTVTRW